jgi:hypothetical protein
MLKLGTRNDVNLREITCEYAKYVDGVNDKIGRYSRFPGRQIGVGVVRLIGRHRLNFERHLGGNRPPLSRPLD